MEKVTSYVEDAYTSATTGSGAMRVCRTDGELGFPHLVQTQLKTYTCEFMA